MGRVAILSRGFRDLPGKVIFEPRHKSSGGARQADTQRAFQAEGRGSAKALRSGLFKE